MAGQPALNHVEEVNRAVHAGSAAVSPVVASWARSSKLHSLSPENDVLPERVEDASLRRQREALGRLVEAAQTSLDEVFVLVGHAGCSVVLANSDGVVLERRGKVADDGTFSNWGLWTGAIWSEASQGTNAIGTALVEQRPVIIHRDQHFLSRNTVLSCMTAPIYDERGGLAAVVDVSSCRPDLSEGFARMIFNLATETAQHIETQNFNLAFAGTRVMLLPDQQKRGVALLAIDKHDIVVGATHAARRALGLPHSGGKLDIPAPQLLKQSELHPDTLDEAERGVLIRTLQRNNFNITKSAQSLDLSRATLYRKLSQHGLAHEAKD